MFYDRSWHLRASEGIFFLFVIIFTYTLNSVCDEQARDFDCFNIKTDLKLENFTIFRILDTE